MADTVSITAGAGTTIATDDVAGVHYQFVKLADGTLDSSTKSKITTAAAVAADPSLVVQNPRSDAFVGSLTETAPATDTASSGLNGRLQRIAQRLTTIYTLLTTGATPYHLRSAATNNATSLKASAGTVHSICASNSNAAARFLKFYNKASAPAPATDSSLLVQSFMIPPSSSGTNVPLPERGLAFTTGIAFAIVAGEGDSDNTSVAAGEQHINLSYL